VLKACSPLFDHKDKSVRDGAKDLAVRRLRSLAATPLYAARCVARPPQLCYSPAAGLLPQLEAAVLSATTRRIV
jgi:hypothetical protein